MNVVFLSQGPIFQASSAPFRLLRNYATRHPDVARECRFVHVSLPAFEHRGVTTEPRLYAYAEEILGQQPDVLALSLYCWNTANLLGIARFCKAIKPKLLIVAGGPDVNDRGVDLLEENRFLDVAVDREGEYPFARLLELLVSGRLEADQSTIVISPRKGLLPGGMEHIPFLSYRQNGAPVRSKSTYIIAELDDIPSPILGVSYANLVTRFYMGAAESVIVETARGCPVKCAFCQYPKNNNKQMRYFGVDRVLAELTHLRAIGVRSVYFGDGIFTVRKERAERFFRFFLDEFRDATMHVELKLDMLPEVLIPLVRELIAQGRLSAGVGVQSVNETTLKRIGRPSNLPRLASTVQALAPARKMRWDIILGLPGDTLDDVPKGIEFVYRHAPGAHVCFNPLQVLPGTDFWHHARDFGLIHQRDNPYRALRSDTFSSEDLARAEVMAEFYETFGRLIEFAAYPGGMGLNLEGMWTEVFGAEAHPLLERKDLLKSYLCLGTRLKAALRLRVPEPTYRDLCAGIEWTLLTCANDGSSLRRLARLSHRFQDFTTLVAIPHSPGTLTADQPVRWASLLDVAHVFRFTLPFQREQEPLPVTKVAPFHALCIDGKLYKVADDAIPLLRRFERPLSASAAYTQLAEEDRSRGDLTPDRVLELVGDLIALGLLIAPQQAAYEGHS